eukprot:scaffold20955_cov66-Phaeocystis_antarctica.AAC.8
MREIESAAAKGHNTRLTSTPYTSSSVHVSTDHLFLVPSSRAQADPQDFERLLMVKPLFTVRDFRTELGDEVTDPGDEELLRNYEFNISQGIVQRVSRFFDALALMDEPPARSAGGPSAPAAAPPPVVMNFGHKRSVGKQEKSAEAATATARKAAEQDAEMAALKGQVAAAAAREVAEQDAEMAALKGQVAAAAAREVAEQDAEMAALKGQSRYLAAPERCPRGWGELMLRQAGWDDCDPIGWEREGMGAK